VREQISDIRVIPAEELVPALSRQRNLDVLGRELGHEITRNSGRISAGLVESLCEPRKK
jgi:hypothetical protein